MGDGISGLPRRPAVSSSGPGLTTRGRCIIDCGVEFVMP